MNSVLSEISDMLHTGKSHPLFELRSVRVDFHLQERVFSALDTINLTGYKQETLGVVGESGCGKSTLAKALLFLQRPTEGQVFFQEQDLGTLSEAALRATRRRMQMIFQDPDASLNPRLSVFEHLKEPLEIHGLATKKTLKEAVIELLLMVQLSPQLMNSYPYQLSGGQKQRVSIARALSVTPSLVVCDEPLASLDISVSSQIVQLLKELQLQKGLSYLFITHDLTFLRQIAHRIAVLYLGNLVEVTSTDALFRMPLHPYTQALLAAIPTVDPQKEKERRHVFIQGEIPSVLTPPPGCPFHTRCPMAQEICRKEKPPLLEAKPGHFVACHLQQAH